MKSGILTIVMLLSCLLELRAQQDSGKIVTTIQTDVCVYGASGSGIFAAIAVAREGYSVTIVEPEHKIGGLLGSGFRMEQDAPSAEHLGGLTGSFYRKDVSQAPLRHPQAAGSFNVSTLLAMMKPYGDLIHLITEHRVLRTEVNDHRIDAAIFEYAPPGLDGIPLPTRASDNLIQVKARVFIDASYEGDLMAYAGVSYRVGKESKSKYGESLAGVIISKKFPGVDPYKIQGDSTSGLLSVISSEPLGAEGDSSRYFMGYNFKLAWESDPSDQFPGITVTPPKEKNADDYELLRRYVKAGYSLDWPNENFERDELVTGAIPGMQVDYPDGDWETRSNVWKAFINHVQTLTDFTGTDLKLVSGINDDTNGWPFLYIRGGRRMVGEYVMTQQDIQLQTDPPSSIGMGYYKIDIYPNRLVVLKDGTLAQEGNVFTLASPGPYQIPYGAIIPKKEECINLLVPLCMSASHVAYSSIRMEATYMVMGESAGVAAAHSIQENKAVQDIDRNKLTSALLQYGQVLSWDGHGYRFGWRSNIFGKPHKEITRWETNPEEYQKHPVETLWKR